MAEEVFFCYGRPQHVHAIVQGGVTQLVAFFFARTHKTGTIEVLGELWLSKACNNDREAVACVPEHAWAKTRPILPLPGWRGLD